jgi:hypothetical protein
MFQPRRIAQIAAALAASFALVACGGSGGSGPSSPTEPKGGQTATLATKHGTVTVITNGNPFDADRAVAAIDAGYDMARSEVGSGIDSVRIDGMLVDVQPGVFNGAVGQYLPNSDTVDMAQGVENVLTHELQHRFCHNLGHSGDCCTYQQHSNGYDLQCKKL